MSQSPLSEHDKAGITLDLYGHLMPGSESEAADLLDAYLPREAGAPTVAHLDERVAQRG